MKVFLFIKKILTHPYLALIFRLYIGGLFIYAGMYKINYTAEFAETIAGYGLVPYWAVNILAAVLPWVELISGILLFIGVRARSAAVIIGTMLILFTASITISLLKGAPISCGCFHSLGERISWWTLLRDFIWLVMSIHIFFYDRALHLERRFSWMLKEV
ncbi:MAG: DoxX family membrane protein [Deltaproteobacteria bacterium]|nr:MAG: DoxX family membrane protein [Deltaproteobacteria bacterium]